MFDDFCVIIKDNDNIVIMRELQHCVQHCFNNIVGQWWSNKVVHGCWFITIVPTTLFQSVRSSSHEQSVPTCMNKPVNNTVQAGQINHVQAGQTNHVQACQQPCSSWSDQPCSSLPTGKNKLCVFTCVYVCILTITLEFAFTLPLPHILQTVLY